MESDKMPWEMQIGEDYLQFEMFTAYLNMRAGRSYPKVAQHFNLSVRTVSSIGKKFNWVRRALLWEADMRQNIKYQYIDYMQKKEKEKFDLKMSLSMQALGLLEHYKEYFTNAHKLYNNRDSNQKLKFIDNVASTLKKLYKLIDFSLDPELSNLKMKREINFEEFLKSVPPDMKKLPKKENYLLNDKGYNALLSGGNPEPKPDPGIEAIKERIEPKENFNIDNFLAGLRSQDNDDDDE
ncbi:MAG: helix-turn-helix domain-containing protein [Bacteroidota bacterium]